MTADTDHPIHALLSQRYSPYAFASKPVADEDLRSLFEAARWSASSYNEQPWRFLVARSDDPGYERLFSCLLEGNQGWAKHAPVIAIGLMSLSFSRNGKPNKAAAHDLGLATAALTLEATARGLAVHPMIGIDPERVRKLYELPADIEALTGLAIGYAGDAADLPDGLRQREEAPRVRKPLSEFVFDQALGQAALFV